jgi:hypothetical protein
MSTLILLAATCTVILRCVVNGMKNNVHLAVFGVAQFGSR